MINYIMEDCPGLFTLIIIISVMTIVMIITKTAMAMRHL